MLDGFGRHLTPEIYAWLGGAAVVITAASATIARLMALAKAQDLLKKFLPIFAYKEVEAGK
ncbi:membrane protein [Arthrobacter phage Rizwana]|nr:membrane protein [Arthrobacter phage Rizwana]